MILASDWVTSNWINFLSAVTTTSDPSMTVVPIDVFILVVLSMDILTCSITYDSYPIIENLIEYFPGGIFKRKYFPDSFDAVPKSVSNIMTLHPIKGSPVSLSVISPVIFPVVPANKNFVKRITRKRYLYFIIYWRLLPLEKI